METFIEKVKEINDIYEKAVELEEEGTRVYSIDEKMGIGAREHINEKQPMKPGVSERVDPEYVRHGVTGIMAALEVSTGKIVSPLIQQTRTEADFLKQIESLISLNDGEKHIFILDNLNTHMSESIVNLVAEYEGMDLADLGVKGKSGILKNKATRSEFLENKNHLIRFVYTPKHCSWLNQVECWFSIITRRLLNKRSSFTSIANLEIKIQKFIDYYNEFLSKPFSWNSTGKLLRFDKYLLNKHCLVN
jgi:hypothetical protein